jgi:hypothetical protein
LSGQDTRPRASSINRLGDDARTSFLPRNPAPMLNMSKEIGGDGTVRSREDGDFSHLRLKLDEELNLDLLGSMITDQSPGGTVATHLGTPMVQTIAAADFLTYVQCAQLLCMRACQLQSWRCERRD